MISTRLAVGASFIAVAITAIEGCEGCRERRPPVLFRSDARPAPPPEPDATALLDGATADIPTFTAIEGAVVEGDGTTLVVEGSTAHAPAGERFLRWLRVDLSGDGTVDDVVASRAGADGTARAPMVLRRVASAYEVVPLLGAEPPDARCAESVVRQTSPRSVSVSWRCPTSSWEPTIAGVASVAEEHCLLALSATPSVRTRAALLAGMLPDTELALHLEGVDLDGDGRDEVRVTLAAGRGGATPRAHAAMVYFDRAGALARDTSEPATSLAANLALARRALTRGRTGAVDALAILDDLVRLRRALCASSGLSRLRFQGVVGADCSGVSTTTLAELYTRTLINLGEMPAAEAQLVADTASDDGAVSSERVLADLERASIVDRTVRARSGPFVGAVLDALMPSRAGVLAFGGPPSSRTLTLRGPATGTLDVATLTFTPGAPGVPGDVIVRSPDGATHVLGLVETCTGVAVLTCATGTACAETPVTETTTTLPAGVSKVVLPVIPSLPFSRRCLQTPASVQGVGARVGRALAWGRDGLVVVFRGALYRVANDGVVAHVRLGESLNGGFTSGAAVSENGATVVLPGLSGLWVRERNAWRRWSPQALTGRFAQMSDLTVTGDARAIAGFVGTQVWLLERANVR